MITTHPYCRTCGSHIQSRKVCHHCGADPIKGHNYCCDCGTSTIAEAIMCVHCGASFQRKIPIALAILVTIAIIITAAGSGYFLSHQKNTSPEIMSDDNSHTLKDTSSNLKILPAAPSESLLVISNNISPKLLKPKNNSAINLIIKNLPKNPKPASLIITPPVVQLKKEEEIVLPPSDVPTTSGKQSLNIFSSGEMRNYVAGCTYFQGKSLNNIIFFTTNVYGYIKINRKVYALQGVQKGNDIARFAGAGFEVTVEIEGLAGNENKWFAEATLTVKDTRQNKLLSRSKIYSSCTDF